LYKTVVEKIVNSSNNRLKNLRDKIYQGTPSGADTVYIVNSDTISKNSFEEELLHPLLRGRNVRRWNILWDGLFTIYPFLKKGSDLEPVQEDLLKKRYPNIHSWFKKHEKILRERKYFGKFPEEKGILWYESWVGARSYLTETPKIITPALSNYNNFTLDTAGYHFVGGGAGVYGIILKNKLKSLNDYQYILGLLNSKIVEYFIKIISPMFSGGYYKYNTQYLDLIPIQLPPNKSEQKLADEITERVEKILTLAKREQHVENFPDSYFDELSGEIEEWDEVGWRPKRNYKEVEIKIDTDLEGERALVFGKDDMLTDPAVDSETKKHYVVEALKDWSVRKDEEIIVKLPKSDAIVGKMLERLEEDKKALEKEPISKLEDEINERVYKLYGLDENDIKVIEEFLEKF
jgi:hypothetical protein